MRPKVDHNQTAARFQTAIGKVPPGLPSPNKCDFVSNRADPDSDALNRRAGYVDSTTDGTRRTVIDGKLTRTGISRRGNGRFHG